MATQSKSQKQSRERISADNNLASRHETTNLQDVLNEWEKRNAELKISSDQYWEEDLINQLTTKNPDLKFGNIGWIWINLSLLLDNSWRWSFKHCLDKIPSDEIKKALMQEIFHKVQNEIWTDKPYDDFEEICSIPWDVDVLWYFLNIISYLDRKENPDQEDAPKGKKTMDIISKILISNSDVNWRLSTPIAPETKLSEMPEDIKNSFDALLSFEFWKGITKAKDITENRMEQFSLLFTTGFPAINTIIWEDEDYRYDEQKLLEKYPEYETKLGEIQEKYKYEEWDNKKQKEEKGLKMLKEIRELKWEYYLQYLKEKNEKLASTLRELYENDFDYSELSDDALKWYLDIVVNKRLNKFKDWIKNIIDENFDNFDEFSKFYKDLADPSSTTIHLNSGFTPWSHTKDSVELPITKSIIKRKNMWLKDIDSFWWNPLSYDALPFRYEIKKDDIDKLDMTNDDKNKLKGYLTRFKDENDKFVIEGEDVWWLILLFFVINNKSPIKEVNSETQEEVEDLLTKKDSDKNGENGNDKWDEALTPEQFKEKIEKHWPGKFENWSEIWLPIWTSELPWWWYQWMKIKISDVDMWKWTFKWTIFWWELKFSSNLEWKSQNFKMNQEFFDGLEKILKKASANPEKIWLQPNPDTSNFNSFVDSLKGKLWTNDFKFPPEWTWLIWKDKFMYEVGDDKNEVKYFWAANDNKSTYKIEYNPTRRSFTVYTTYNWDEKWKDWKTEKKRCSYKRNMDWNNFLIFFTQKWLQPQTEEEANDAIQMQEQELKIVNGWKLSLHWFSLNTIKNWFKDIWGAVKKGMDDYGKKQEKEFKEIVEKPLLDAISMLPLVPSLKYAVWKRQQELYADQVNWAWPKIEEYLKEFQSDEQFADTFDQLPPNVKTLHWKSYKDFITNLFDYKWTREIKLDDRHKAAAILLANIQKWGSPYRGLTEYQDEWLWVKVLLGQEHYRKFLRDKQKCIDDLKSAWKNKDQIQHTLATWEMEYIINNICWSNWKLPYFGSHEARGYPGKWYSTNYVVNPSKRDLSEKFAGELRNAYQPRFTANSVDQAFDKISHNNFEQAKADVKRLLTSARNPGAIGNLRAMFKLAKTPEQLLECDRHFLIYMLSGILDVYGTKNLRKQAYEWGTTTSFLPWMLAKNTGHSEQVVQLLDDFCEEKWYKKFSEIITAYFKKSDLKRWKMDINGLFEQVLDDSKRSLDKMKEFEEYSKVTFRSKDFSNKPVLRQLQKDALNPDTENINNSILENKLIANRSWLFSNANVVRDRMSLDGSWQFSWKDEDEKGDRKEFWDNVRLDIWKMDPKNERHLAIVLTQFFNFFNLNSQSSKQEILKWINTADYWSKGWKMWKMATYPPEPKPWEDYINMWVIGKAEIDSILWYAFKGRVLLECLGGKRIPAELMSTLDAFQNFFQEAFHSKDGTNTFKNPSIISKGFQLENLPSNDDAFSLCSWDLFNSLIDNENRKELHLDDKQTEIAKTIMNGDIINYKIAQMEKALNRSWEEYFRPIRGSIQQTLRNKLSG